MDTSEREIVYTADEGATRLKISRTHMFNLLRTGEVESFKIGRCRRIAASALIEYVERQRVAA